MVQSADLRDFHDSSGSHGLNWPTDRRVLVQRQMSPRALVVFEVRFQHSAQTFRIQNDHVIQTLAANRSQPGGGLPSAHAALGRRERIATEMPRHRRTLRLLSFAPAGGRTDHGALPGTLKARRGYKRAAVGGP
jgi:hypothetical protein